MKKTWKRLCTGFLALATVVTALPSTPVHAESKQYWTESAERVGIIEKVMNDGSIGSTFNEGMMKVEGETAYCIDINTDFKNGYKTRADASSRMSADQISDVALSLEYVKQYGEAHKELNYKQVYLLEQCVVWQRLSVHLGWQCDNVRASYDEIPKATQDEVFSGAKAFVKENKGRYECGGYIYSGEGQELGQFWTKLNVGNAKLQKTSSNTSITNGNGNYSVAGAIYGVFSDKDCTKQLATLTTDENGNTDVVEVKAGTVYIKELSAPAGYKVDKTVYSLKIEAGKTATLNVSDTPKVTDTLIELFKIDMETQKDNPQGNASLAGAEFTWKYYAGFYTKDNLPAEATRTWVTKTIAETDSDGTTHYITKLADAYKVSGDSFYMQDGKAVFPLGTLTVAEHKDIEDDGQTVLITERIIKIHTTATDKDGNKELEAGKEVTIVDTVTLEGLEVGTQYKLVGWQMLKEENAELLINGKHVESDYTFTADSETMKVEVTFTFDATSLDGKQLVTFEELYDLSNPDEPKKVTEHKDIEDEGQTITFKEKPEVPEEPEKPEIPQTPDTPHKTNSPKTGDSTNLYGLLALLMTSGAGLAGIFFYKRRKMKKS
ncbi:VaFE repeat-containing surface-anchored protein [Blautia wexlerae]|nr:VaFE repeat-containing surface-anchored protein [Blautia wexlerae]